MNVILEDQRQSRISQFGIFCSFYRTSLLVRSKPHHLSAECVTIYFYNTNGYSIGLLADNNTLTI
jgi:hypothetical protein